MGANNSALLIDDSEFREASGSGQQQGSLIQDAAGAFASHALPMMPTSIGCWRGEVAPRGATRDGEVTVPGERGVIRKMGVPIVYSIRRERASAG